MAVQPGLCETLSDKLTGVYNYDIRPHLLRFSTKPPSPLVLSVLIGSIKQIENFYSQLFQLPHDKPVFQQDPVRDKSDCTTTKNG